MTTASLDYRVLHIRHAGISPDPDQPRKTFSEDGIRALADSIGAEGLLQPITVRPARAYTRLNQHSKYILVAGERRWRAMGVLGWDTVPAIVKDMDAQSIRKAQLLENAVRIDLNPIEEARAYKNAVDEGISMYDLAKAIGFDGPYSIQWRLEMLRAREEILHLVSIGQAKPTVAWAMSKLTPDGQLRVLRAMNMNKMDTAQVTMLCDRIWSEENQSEMFPETRITAEQVRAVRNFSTAFENIGAELSRIQRMYDDNPQALQQAFAAEAATLDAKIGAAISGLNKVRKMVSWNVVNEMVV